MTHQVTDTTVSLATCRLRLARELRQHEAPQLRGFFGRKFEDEVLMHNHAPDGSLIYQYPRIQFKVVERSALLMGIGEGAELLQRLWLEIDETQLGGEELKVLETQFESRQEEIRTTSDPITYQFVTPWLALNQKNFSAYTGSHNQRFRKDELTRILVGNCLGMAKSLGIRFTDRIVADCGKLTSIKTSLKGQGMIGFVGRFTVNVEIPEYLGLGKSVSRGFGAVSPA